MTLFRLLLGIALLAAGRNLFWLFLGGTGFILGFDLAGRLVHGQPQGIMFFIAVVAGVACALLALFLQIVRNTSAVLMFSADGARSSVVLFPPG